MSKQPNPSLNIDIKNTTAVTSPEGNAVFAEGVILRKVSRFVTGTSEDGIIPVPCFYDVVTGKPLLEMLPKELRSEFEETSPEHLMD
jgi:hypothetical protein